MLHLMQSAEKTNALKRAFKLMEQAETLDALNPDVRKARLRLLISLATRHLQQKKIHLAEPELRQMEALPQAQQGDRPALLAALRWVYWTLGGDAAQAAAARASVVGLLGSETAAHILLMAVAGACKLKQELAIPKSNGVPLAAGIGRACALSEDAGWPVEIPRSLSEQAGAGTVRWMAHRPTRRGWGRSAKRRCARTIIRSPGRSRGPASTSRKKDGPNFCSCAPGLCRTGPKNARPSVRPPHPNWRAGNATPTCLRRIGEWREEEMVGFDGDQTDVTMSTEQIDQLIQSGKRIGFPRACRRTTSSAIVRRAARSAKVCPPVWTR